MKITQDTEFRPITLTLETKEEADAFYDLMQRSINGAKSNTERRMLNHLYKWFSDCAQMGKE